MGAPRAGSLALPALVFLLPFEPRRPILPLLGFQLTLLEAAAGVMGAVLLWSVRRRVPSLLRRPPLPLAFLGLYAAAHVLSAAFAPAHRDLAARFALRMLVMAGLGFWTASRGNHWPGRAAIRASIIASIPLVVVGVLMWAGILSFVELSPGQSPISTDGGVVYAFYKGQQQIPGPAPLVMVLSPLLRLPGAWLWGSVGGWLGRTYADWRRRPISA